MTEQERQELQGFSLEEKISYAKGIIKNALDEYGEGLVLAWTGGKDSTVMLWLYKNVCDETRRPLPKCIFINEGDVFDEILEIVDKVKSAWIVDVRELKNDDVLRQVGSLGDMVKVAELNQRNRKELEHLNFAEAEFPFEPESFAGNHLMKTVPLKLFIEESGVKALSTAIRWDEQEARKNEIFFSGRDNPSHFRVQPILHFKERDIWETIQQNKIPYCSLYELGYRSLGARCSTHRDSDIPAWQQDLENTPERVGRGQDKEAIMSQLRDLGYM